MPHDCRHFEFFAAGGLFTLLALVGLALLVIAFSRKALRWGATGRW